MSFLLDPPAIIGTAAAIEVAIPDEKARKVAEAAVVATFVTFSVGLYLEKPATAWLWKMFRANSGRDWMINSGVTSFEYEEPPLLTTLIGGAIFATYPAWALVGRRIGQNIRTQLG